MRMRTLLASIHLLNFLIGIIATGYILNTSWSHLETWQLSLYIYYLVLVFCGAVIACWVVMDGRHIERCALEIRDLEKRLLDLEKQIDRIKTLKL
jgi:uncharacterized membrane protein YciS (DUF1049 family)